MRRFNDLADFSRDEIADLIALAARLDAKPEPRALEGKVLSLLFLSPSLRTLSSLLRSRPGGCATASLSSARNPSRPPVDRSAPRDGGARDAQATAAMRATTSARGAAAGMTAFLARGASTVGPGAINRP